MEPVASAVVLGFVLGLQHATDPDHLVAVATIMTRERRFRDGARVGALWGLGHTLTLVLVGGTLIAAHVRLAPVVGSGFEVAVAVMLVLLGTLRLRDALRGLAQGAPEHLAAAHVADHQHAGAEVFHSHGHDHGGRVHAHPHVHPSRRLLGALGAGGASSSRAVAVGAVHGLAGSAALSLLVLATLRSTGDGLLYLAVFGLGTVAGMTALTAVMAYPLALAGKLRPARRLLAVGAGGGSIVFGLVYGIRAVTG